MRPETEIDKPAIRRIASHSLIAFLLCCSTALSQSGGDYEIRKSTIDAGGGRSTGGRFELTATVGQPDTQKSTGGRFSLQGGFWTAAPVPLEDALFSDGFESP